MKEIMATELRSHGDARGTVGLGYEQNAEGNVFEDFSSDFG